jgi:hypothetical protein
MSRSLYICAIVAVLLAIPTPSRASLFEITYTGDVGGASSDALPLLSFPLGTPISFTVTFDDVFLSDDPAVLFGPPRPTSGSVDIGGTVYQLTSHEVGDAYVESNPFALISANYHFFGTGPVVDGLEFFGLFVRIMPDLTLHTGTPLQSVALGWDSNPGETGSFKYLRATERTQQYSVQPLEVPAAPLGWMILTGIGAALGRRVRSIPR